MVRSFHQQSNFEIPEILYNEPTLKKIFSYTKKWDACIVFQFTPYEESVIFLKNRKLSLKSDSCEVGLKVNEDKQEIIFVMCYYFVINLLCHKYERARKPAPN